MTDHINSVSGTHATSSGGTYSGGTQSEEHKRKDHREPQEDLVEISRDARDRSKSTPKKNISDRLKELLE